MKKEKVETPKVEKYVNVDELNLLKGEAIDIENLNTALTSIKLDAEKANKGNKAAGRRFRLNTVAISAKFLEIRKVTPRALTKKLSK